MSRQEGLVTVAVGDCSSEERTRDVEGRVVRSLDKISPSILVVHSLSGNGKRVVTGEDLRRRIMSRANSRLQGVLHEDLTAEGDLEAGMCGGDEIDVAMLLHRRLLRTNLRRIPISEIAIYSSNSSAFRIGALASAMFRERDVDVTYPIRPAIGDIRAIAGVSSAQVAASAIEEGSIYPEDYDGIRRIADAAALIPIRKLISSRQ